MTWLLLLLCPARAGDPPPDPLRVEGDFAVHVQTIIAPSIAGVQEGRAVGHPTLEGEVELRNDRFGVRLHAGLFPVPLVLDAGIALLAHDDDPRLARFAGLEVGAAHAFFRNRVYGGPVAGVRGPWRSGSLSGIVGARLTLGLALDLGSENDWTLTSPGPAVGLHGGVALTFAPGEE